MKNLSLRFIPATIASSVFQINLLIGTYFQSFHDGAISLYSYADRLYMLPLSLISTALATVLLPSMSAASKDRKASKAYIDSGVMLTILLITPLAALLFVLAVPFINLAFVARHGAFKAELVPTLGLIVQIFCLGLPSFALNKILTQAFFAAGLNRLITMMACLMIGINAILTYVLMNKIGIYANAVATSFSSLMQILCMFYLLKKKRDYQLSLKMLVYIGSIIGLSLMIALLGLWILPYVETIKSLGSKLLAYLSLALGCLGLYAAGIKFSPLWQELKTHLRKH